MASSFCPSSPGQGDAGRSSLIRWMLSDVMFILMWGRDGGGGRLIAIKTKIVKRNMKTQPAVETLAHAPK